MHKIRGQPTKKWSKLTKNQQNFLNSRNLKWKELRLPKKNMVSYFIFETDIIILFCFFFSLILWTKRNNEMYKKQREKFTEKKWIIMLIVCWAQHFTLNSYSFHLAIKWRYMIHKIFSISRSLRQSFFSIIQRHLVNHLKSFNIRKRNCCASIIHPRGKWVLWSWFDGSGLFMLRFLIIPTIIIDHLLVMKGQNKIPKCFHFDSLYNTQYTCLLHFLHRFKDRTTL